VGSGKTSLLAALCRSLGDRYSIAAVTNDIYTAEDARILREAAVLPKERIVAVETGCCPRTAIRDDISANLEAIEGLEAAFEDLDLVLVESGGATSPLRSAMAWSTVRSSSWTWREGRRCPAREVQASPAPTCS